MATKKGYGLIIPKEWKAGKWNKLSAREILAQLKVLNHDAFYRMAEGAGIDIALLEMSGYDYDGVSELALIELGNFLSLEKFNEVKKIITAADRVKDSDFAYVLRRYNDRNNVVGSLYADDEAKEILEQIAYVHIDLPESERQLMRLFIDEFHEDKAAALNETMNLYGGHLVYIPEFESFVSGREYIAWFRGDAIDAEYGDEIKRMKAMLDLVSVYKLIADGGEFQIQSARIRQHKVNISKEATDILAKGLAMTLKMLHDTNPSISLDADVDRTFSSFEMKMAGNDIAKIEDDLSVRLESYDEEFDLGLFYYLADNAISWPDGFTLTNRYLFLYKLAKFFKFVSDAEYEKTISISMSKEIVDGIKYRIKQMHNRDKDGKLLDWHLHGDDM